MDFLSILRLCRFWTVLHFGQLCIVSNDGLLSILDIVPDNGHCELFVCKLYIGSLSI